jgi:signal transduction histidine kinase
VADAFAGAVGEALMNVVRHARVSEISLCMSVLNDVVTIEITDRGRGFDTTAVPVHHYGIREAVTGRMRTVGGEGRVVSAPGAGTKVELWWPHHDG